MTNNEIVKELLTKNISMIDENLQMCNNENIIPVLVEDLKKSLIDEKTSYENLSSKLSELEINDVYCSQLVDALNRSFETNRLQLYTTWSMYLKRFEELRPNI